MSEAISKASVCEILADIYPTDGEKVVAVKEVDKAYKAIQQLPSAQQKTGKWLVRIFENEAKCSECGFWFRDVYDMNHSDNYCRHCGAKMKGLKVINI